MDIWTQDQWIAFTGMTSAGVGAVILLMLALRAMRQWTAPAPLQLATAHRTAEPWSVTMQRANGWKDPMKADYTDAGIGALSSIHAVAADPALVTEHERHAAEDSWINEYASIRAMMPETAAATEVMRIALEPALRKARLWLMQGGETGAKAVLNTWRMDTPTGEYLSPFSISHRAVAAALLES